MQKELLSLLNPRCFDSWNNQFDISGTLGKASTLAKKGYGLHLPLVVRTMRTSPGFAKAATWRAKRSMKS